MVRLLKRVLPALALVLVIIFAAISLMRRVDVENISVARTGISDGKLVMEKPRMKGFNKESLPFDLNAARAIQDISKPGLVALESIDAILPVENGEYADIIAQNGIYNSTKEWLSLENSITVDKKDGTHIELESAEIDLKSGSLTSDQKVKVTTPTSYLTANQIEIIDNGDTIIFNQRVRMILQPSDETE